MHFIVFSSLFERFSKLQMFIGQKILQAFRISKPKTFLIIHTLADAHLVHLDYVKIICKHISFKLILQILELKRAFLTQILFWGCTCMFTVTIRVKKSVPVTLLSQPLSGFLLGFPCLTEPIFPSIRTSFHNPTAQRCHLLVFPSRKWCQSFTLQQYLEHRTF